MPQNPWNPTPSSLRAGQIEPLLLNTRGAARALTISERMLWTLTQAGDIPCVRIERLVRYDPRDLVDWIEHKKGAPSKNRADLPPP